MPKLPLSVTLEQENLIWLRAQTVAGRRRSLSETLDQLVTDARRSGRVVEGSARSVHGTIDINDADPDLLEADVYVRERFGRLGRQPSAAKVNRAVPKRRTSRSR